MSHPEPGVFDGVSPIELFFDLVFVFVITQITHLVEHAHGMGDYFRALLVFVPIWWTYAGFTWLTNNVGASARMRFVLIAAMAGFLVIAMSIPDVFGAGALSFGFAYLFVVLVYLGTFWSEGRRSAMRGMLVIAPFNLCASAFIIGAGFVGEQWSWAMFLGAALLFVASTVVRRDPPARFNAEHFAERHGLIILIVLGESVISIALGDGDSSRLLDVESLTGVLLSLALVASLWWCYFDRENEHAERLLAAASLTSRTRMGLLAYWYAHLALISGIVLIAAGIKQLLDYGDGSSRSGESLLCGGMSVFMLGDVFFRRVMGMRPVWVRLAAAVVALLLGVAGTRWGAYWALASVAALVVAVIVIERRLEVRTNAAVG